MTRDEIQKQIAELEASKLQVRSDALNQLNYNLGFVDGRIALLQELMETGKEPPEDDHADAT
jgi:hypothetical protein